MDEDWVVDCEVVPRKECFPEDEVIAVDEGCSDRGVFFITIFSKTGVFDVDVRNTVDELLIDSFCCNSSCWITASLVFSGNGILDILSVAKTSPDVADVVGNGWLDRLLVAKAKGIGENDDAVVDESCLFCCIDNESLGRLSVGKWVDIVVVVVVRFRGNRIIGDLVFWENGWVGLFDVLQAVNIVVVFIDVVKLSDVIVAFVVRIFGGVVDGISLSCLGESSLFVRTYFLDVSKGILTVSVVAGLTSLVIVLVLLTINSVDDSNLCKWKLNKMYLLLLWKSVEQDSNKKENITEKTFPMLLIWLA